MQRFFAEFGDHLVGHFLQQLRVGGQLQRIVCDAGGMVAHPAVMAREFSIPGVTGTMIATRDIKTGDRIRVDGAAGVVEILEG